MIETIMDVERPDLVPTLFGPEDRYLKQIQADLNINVVFRHDQLKFQGEKEDVEFGLQVVMALLNLLENKQFFSEQDFQQILEGNRETEHAELDRELESHLKMDRHHHFEGSDSGKARSSRVHLPYDVSAEESETFGKPIDLYEPSRSISPRTKGQEEYVNAIFAHDLVFCTGPAGCGKTYLSVAAAINALRTERVRKIVLVRPAVEAGEKIGFLPGDMLAKVNPFLRPLLDALGDMLDYEQVKRYMNHDIIEILPLGFMRGRTLNETFMILDEAQNTTVTQMKMFLTRMGASSKIVVTGDVTQMDLASDVTCGMTDAIRRLSSIRGVASVQLTGDDIVRHRLVREIVKAYDDQKRSLRSH